MKLAGDFKLYETWDELCEAATLAHRKTDAGRAERENLSKYMSTIPRYARAILQEVLDG